MNIVVVTSFSAAGYEQYGRRFLQTFDRFFPGHIQIFAYAEAPMPGAPGRVTGRSLLALPDFKEFRARWDGNALASGREETPVWKSKDRADGYCYKTDAMKFCRKVFAIKAAANELAGEPDTALFWIDADVVATASPPTDFFEDILNGHTVAYLGRTGTHSECGFLGFRLPTALPFINRWANFYSQDRWLKEKEWHDSYLFDRVRETTAYLRARDISPGGRGHVWHQTVLGNYLDHLKGQRKKLGYSPERRGAT